MSFSSRKGFLREWAHFSGRKGRLGLKLPALTTGKDPTVLPFKPGLGPSAECSVTQLNAFGVGIKYWTGS